MELRQKIGDYELKDPSRFAEGGMARVYQATHPELPMTVAIKEPRPDCRTPDYISIFKTEAERTAQLKHDNIVEIHDSGLDEDPPFVVLEWLPDSVGQLLENETRISWQRAVNYAIQVCRALYFAHTQDPPLIHQDIKPDNLLRTPLETIKVSDFGLSYAIKTAESVPPIFDTKGGGTRSYQPAEQFYDSPVDARTDIYALGITLFECIAGYLPFQDDNEFKLFKLHENEPLPEFPDDAAVPYALKAIISTATAKDPDGRYADARTMGQALEALETTTQREVGLQEELDRRELEWLEEEELRIAQKKQDVLRLSHMT